jgi:hypothetical protein
MVVEQLNQRLQVRAAPRDGDGILSRLRGRAPPAIVTRLGADLDEADLAPPFRRLTVCGEPILNSVGRRPQRALPIGIVTRLGDRPVERVPEGDPPAGATVGVIDAQAHRQHAQPRLDREQAAELVWLREAHRDVGSRVDTGKRRALIQPASVAVPSPVAG